MRCRRCGVAMPVGLFCPQCQAVQPLPNDTDYSLLLGFEGRPEIDEGLLRERYYELSRKLHPDRFQTGSVEEQRASLQATALLNAAYKTLRDVESRGRWWLERNGESLGHDNNRVPPALAELVFDVQEKLESHRAASGTDRGALASELRGIAAQLGERLDAGRSDVEALLRSWPTGTADDAARPRDDLKQALSELSYLQTLARDVRRALED